MSSRKTFFPSLTGIRAIAVYFIFFKHWNFFSEEKQHSAFLFLNQFYTFLTFFFVLSGFVICYKYYSIRTLEKRRLYNYFINRMSRVFPLLFVLITFTFLSKYLKGVSEGQELFKTYMYNITLLKGFSQKYILTGIGPTWSLSVEELFYLSSPLIFLFAINTKSLTKIVLFVYLIGALLTILFNHLKYEGFFESFEFTFYATFFGRVFEFACGIYLALIMKNKIKNKFLLEVGYRSTYIGGLIIIASLILQYFIAMKYNVPHAANCVPGLIVNNIIMPIGIMIFFYGLINHESLINRFLSLPLLVTLGNCTYSFYLLHTSIIGVGIAKYINGNPLVVLACMIPLSFLCYKFFEEPTARFLRQKLSLKNEAIKSVNV